MSRSKNRERKAMLQAAAAARAHERATQTRKHERSMAKIAAQIDRLKNASTENTAKALSNLKQEALKQAQEAHKQAKHAASAERAWGKYGRSLTTQTARGRGVPFTSTAERTTRAIYGSGTAEKGAVSKGPGVFVRKKRGY